MRYVMYGKGVVGKAMLGLLEYEKYEYVWMDDADKDDTLLDQADRIVVTPGISPKHMIYQKYSHKLVGELDLCWEILEKYAMLDRVKFYCITGTNGKSTVTWVLYHALYNLKSDHHNIVKIGGNFEPALCEVVKELIQTISSTASGQDLPIYHLVIEVSSYMCYLMQKFQSDYTIITNLAVDHLQWHKDLEEYRGSKLKLIDHTKYASVVDQTVIEFQKSKSSSNSTATSSFKVSSKVIPYHPCIDLQQTQFIGEHNNSNLSAVFQLLKEVTEGELSLDKYYDLIRDVKPLAHRCQYVMEIDGIQIIDDLHATGAHAQRAALRSVHDKLILICGGFDKGDDYSIVSHEYETTVAGGVIIGKSSLPFSALFDQHGIEYTHTEDMYTGLTQAFSLAKKLNVGVILYSPGAASFDLYRNREERATDFEHQLQKLVDI